MSPGKPCYNEIAVTALGKASHQLLQPGSNAAIFADEMGAEQ
jgi:hypothetical protein